VLKPFSDNEKENIGYILMTLAVLHYKGGNLCIH
jgi:hypothetical protein